MVAYVSVQCPRCKVWVRCDGGYHTCADLEDEYRRAEAAGELVITPTSVIINGAGQAVAWPVGTGAGDEPTLDVTLMAGAPQELQIIDRYKPASHTKAYIDTLPAKESDSGSTGAHNGE